MVTFIRSASGSKDGASPLTFSLDGTGGNFLAVLVFVDGTNASGVTYNSVSLTSQITQTFSARGRRGHPSIFTLVSPSSGTNTVSVTYSGYRKVVARALLFSGVDTADPIEGTNSQAQGTTDPISLSITQANDVPSLGILGCNGVSLDGPRNWTPGGSMTEFLDSDDNPLGTIFGGYETFTGSGSKTLSSNFNYGGTLFGTVGIALLVNGTESAAADNAIFFGTNF